MPDVNEETTSTAFLTGAQAMQKLLSEMGEELKQANQLLEADNRALKQREEELARASEVIENLKNQLSFTNSNWPHEKKALEELRKTTERLKAAEEVLKCLVEWRDCCASQDTSGSGKLRRKMFMTLSNYEAHKLLEKGRD